MKTMFRIFAALTLFGCGPSFAKERSEFPSRSIRPVISTAESDRALGHVEPQRREVPSSERTTAAAHRFCARPYNARDERNADDRRNCSQENNALTHSNVPQLSAFRQPATQRFAP